MATIDEANERGRLRETLLAKVLLDLDRCPHGRHEGDTCAGWAPDNPSGGCRGGVSLGNPFIGIRIGTGLHGEPLYHPARHERHDPKAWTRTPAKPQGPGLSNVETARALDESEGLCGLWRQMGMSWHQKGRFVLTYSQEALVGMVEVDEDGNKRGIPMVIVNELTDEQIAERDRGQS